MIRSVLLIVTILFAGSAVAQKPLVDSLTGALERHRAEDTLRLHLLNELSFAYYQVDPAQGAAIAGQAIELAGRLRHPAMLAAAYNNKGTNHWAMGEDSLARGATERALNIHLEAGNKLGAAKALNNLALSYYNMSDFRKALEYHQEALSLFTGLEHYAGIANTYSNMGVVYLALSDYPQALKYFLDVARQWRGKDSAATANTLVNIGLVYKNMKDYPRALQYAGEALSLYASAGNRQGEANACGNLGTLYNEHGDPQTALQYYKRGLALNTSIGNKRRIASDLVNIGTVYQGMNDNSMAHDYLERGLRLYEQTNDRENTVYAMIKLAETNIDLGNTAGARSSLQKAIQLASEASSVQNQSFAWEAMSKVLQQSGQYNEALQAYKRHIALRDSIFNSAKARSVMHMQIQFEFEKKEALLKAAHERDNALARAEARRRKAIEIAVLTGLLLLIAAAAGGYALYRKRRDAEMRVKMADTEMKALRAQMNPHFIFNSLNAISAFISRNEPLQADDYLVRFSAVIRTILENSEFKEITLSEDLQVLEHYMKLERTRLNGAFDYTVRIDGTIDPHNTLVPPLLLQPFVENSIWHGLSGIDRQGRILIDISLQNGGLVCVVEDNGRGRQSRQAANGRKSMGIPITRSRVRIWNNSRGKADNIIFTDLEQGTKVMVTIQLKHKF
ncbi:hypothetical protein DLD77_04770 [Chitinophaga alhagiae]|uniref:Signal transduction histidine kinase internal region domain-containing protein n=1 Tax=Chitinophaga alhagiae TaxID=2203219 RepID=A0ABM6WB02_9BACT|nr:tetratricopeptide repeat protein [Chitinophaga alhagiae]AWO01059.1 hypothetical protein DLD77_04770 [Chitinophaga alhagiae]